MNTAQTIHNEILALRRIQAFDGYFSPNLGAGMWEFDRYITMQLCDGVLSAEVDFYSQNFYRCDPLAAFDDEAWEAQKMHWSAPATREVFKELYFVCRTLLRGGSIRTPNGEVFSRDSYLAQVREGATASQPTQE